VVPLSGSVRYRSSRIYTLASSKSLYFHISDQTVQQKIAELDEEIDLCKAVVVLYNNSVLMVGGAGGTKHLPGKDSTGAYHVDGELELTNEAGVKDLTNKLIPFSRVGGGGFLSPLARYWLDPCCDAEGHVTNKKTLSYLQQLERLLQAFQTTSMTRSSRGTIPTSMFCAQQNIWNWAPEGGHADGLGMRSCRHLGQRVRYIQLMRYTIL
jgi:hypothetical protein